MSRKPIDQGSATDGPRAECGPTRHFTLPATFFRFSMIDIQQQTAEMILIPRRKPFLWSLPPIRAENGLNFERGPFFWSSPSIRSKKGLNFWRTPFSFGPLKWWRPGRTLLGLID